MTAAAVRLRQRACAKRERNETAARQNREPMDRGSNFHDVTILSESNTAAIRACGPSSPFSTSFYPIGSIDIPSLGRSSAPQRGWMNDLDAAGGHGSPAGLSQAAVGERQYLGLEFSITRHKPYAERREYGASAAAPPRAAMDDGTIKALVQVREQQPRAPI